MVGFHQVNNQHIAQLMQTRRRYSVKLNNIEKFRHMASIVTQNGHILSTGNNYMLNAIPISIHAEHDAINKAIKSIIRKGDRHKLKKTPMKVNIYVVRDNGRNSRPCNDCITNRIANNPYFNIKNIIYTHEDGIDGTITESRQSLYQNRYEHITRHFRNIDIEHNTSCCIHSTNTATNHDINDDIIQDEEEEIEGKTYIYLYPNR